ncbi:MAG: tetratricopeptide repeat protein [Puniceicoccales bacterium]|nr:tetratricopeptide repeat protein [Puniceicoccales bacterium]
MAAKNAPAWQSAKVLFNRALTYEKRGEREKALADYTAVIEIKDAFELLKERARERIEKIKNTGSSLL